MRLDFSIVNPVGRHKIREYHCFSIEPKTPIYSILRKLVKQAIYLGINQASICPLGNFF